METKLILLVAGLHLLGLVLVTMLLVMLLRSDTVEAWSPPEEDDGGGSGNDRARPRGPDPGNGGLPLPDALPARFRLRDHVCLGELYRAPQRRPDHQPDRRPAPTPVI